MAVRPPSMRPPRMSAGGGTLGTVLNVAEGATAFTQVLPQAWKFTKWAGPASHAVSGASLVFNSWRQARSKEEQISLIMESLGIPPEQRTQFLRRSRMCKGYLENSVYLTNATGFAASTYGSMKGAALGTWLIPVPVVGTMVGAAAGGAAGHYAHSAVCGEDHNANALAHITGLCDTLSANQEVEKKAVFSALASTLSEAQREVVCKRLREADPKTPADWDKFIRDNDNIIKPAVLRLLGNDYDSSRTATEQLTTMINNRQFNPAALVFDFRFLPCRSQEAEVMRQGVDVADGAAVPASSIRRPGRHDRETDHSLRT